MRLALLVLSAVVASGQFQWLWGESPTPAPRQRPMRQRVPLPQAQVTTRDHVQAFWKDVSNWAVNSTRPECPELVERWLTDDTVIQASGLPHPFLMHGKKGTVCKVLRRLLLISLQWEVTFVDEGKFHAMGKLWLKAKLRERNNKSLPDDLQFVFTMLLSPEDKLLRLDIIPLEPEMIYNAVVTKPVKTAHHLLQLILDEGITSKSAQKLLSDKFELLVPNLYMDSPGFKMKYNKTESQAFADQNLKQFDLEHAIIGDYSVPFYDNKSVVAVLRFDELRLVHNNASFNDMEFWMEMTFQCGEDKQGTVGRSQAQEAKSHYPSFGRRDAYTTQPATVEQGPQNSSQPAEDFCVLERLNFVVNRPLNMLTRTLPAKFIEDGQQSYGGV